MKNSDLGSKKMNNEQQVNEKFSGENIPEDFNSSAPSLKKELEIDVDGKVREVKRARHVDKGLEDSKPAPSMDYPTKSIHQTPKKAEHKDFNSNPNPEQFPDKNKQNQENRGNITE
ncbi:hypothetical protein [Flavobacterium sp.]|uniref:hypothetical protein n=1 Tax=Flavobacterium sp. TaxID=239 RepID=UPI0026270CF6|nr:hypothetical protein [Flavobacterium sp.]MDD3003885.1 hypothetical protein [Flavobacterium sp.]